MKTWQWYRARIRWAEMVEGRGMAEVATLECLGNELEEEPLEVHWMRLPATEKITLPLTTNSNRPRSRRQGLL